LRADGILEVFDGATAWLASASDIEDPLLVVVLIFVGLAMRCVDGNGPEELETLADAVITGNGAFRDWEATSFNRGIRPPSGLYDAIVLPDSNLQLQSED
jgi:hypothetical protein